MAGPPDYALTLWRLFHDIPCMAPNTITMASAASGAHPGRCTHSTPSREAAAQWAEPAARTLNLAGIACT